MNAENSGKILGKLKEKTKVQGEKKIVLRNATDRARKTGISRHRSRTEIEGSTLTPELFRIQVSDLNSANFF